MLGQDYFELKISIWTPLPNLILHTHTEGIQAKFREKQGPLLNNWECNKNVAGHQAIFFFFVEQTKKPYYTNSLTIVKADMFNPFRRGGGDQKFEICLGSINIHIQGLLLLASSLEEVSGPII